MTGLARPAGWSASVGQCDRTKQRQPVTDIDVQIRGRDTVEVRHCRYQLCSFLYVCVKCVCGWYVYFCCICLSDMCVCVHLIYVYLMRVFVSALSVSCVCK